MEHAHKKNLLLERIKKSNKKRNSGVKQLFSIFNEQWKLVTITAFTIGFLNYWTYLYSIGRRDFIWDSLGGFNTFIIFSISVTLSTMALAFFLYAPSLLIFLIRYEKVGRRDLEPCFCLLMSFFFSVFIIFLLSILFSEIKGVLLIIGMTITLIFLIFFIITRFMFGFEGSKLKSTSIAMGLSIYSLFFMVIIINLSDMGSSESWSQLLAMFTLLMIQLLPGLVLFLPGKKNSKRNKKDDFVLSVVFGVYIMLIAIPGAFLYAQYSSLKFFGIIDVDTHIFHINKNDFDNRLIDKVDWSLDSGFSCMKNGFDYKEGSLIAGAIGFRSGGRILVCPPNYPKVVKAFLRERMLIINYIKKGMHVDLEKETKKCIALSDTPSLQQDVLESTFFYGYKS
ncbi:TPA: hypothetical protein QIF53_002131 [Serratia marcescens]|nr:hypothetical protein [Serratia marcescens]